MKKYMRGIAGRIISVSLAIMLLMMLPFGNTIPSMDGLVLDAKAAVSYGLENPTVDKTGYFEWEDGITIWDCIYFGSYYQDNANSKSPIKWRVLHVDGKDAFLMADMNLYRCRYQENSEKGYTWAESSVRTWLNGDFYNAAFTASEKNAIIATTVKTAVNPKTGTKGGANTKDKIYLLSFQEAIDPAYGFSKNYSSNNVGTGVTSRQSKDTAYAASLPGATSTTSGFPDMRLWYLRTPGNDISVVNGAGVIVDYKESELSGLVSVRPVLHIDLEKAGWTRVGTVDSEGTTAIVRQVYTVAFNANGGKNAPEAQVKNKGKKLTLSKVKPVRSGYVFKGWATSRTASTAKYQPGGTYTADAGITLYAVWAKKASSKKTSQKIKAPSSKNVAYKGSVKLGAKAKTSLTYSSNNKNVKVSKKGVVTGLKYGKAVITVKAKSSSKYKAASKKIKITVVPKKPTIKSTKVSRTRTVKITLSSVDKTVDGYQLYICRSKQFKSGVSGLTRRTKDFKNKSLTLGLPKKNTTYYLKMRAYKKVGKTTYYGAWSKVRQLKK